MSLDTGSSVTKRRAVKREQSKANFFIMLSLYFIIGCIVSPKEALVKYKIEYIRYTFHYMIGKKSISRGKTEEIVVDSK